jgi:cellulose biosynthesis protein BcsQ
VDDPRTLNKQLIIRPEPNIKSVNEVVQLWENKIGHSLDKTYVPESEVLKQIEGKKRA